MSKSNIRKLLVLGVVCLVIVLGSTWYTNKYNEGRLVTPTDFSNYRFQFNDLPMMIALLLVIAYVVYFVFSVVQAGVRKEGLASPYARTISPKLGLLGFMGFLGLLGFWTYKTDKLIFPFIFFNFFGFFGLYFQGKMSHIRMDERFIENAQQAQIIAYKTGLLLMFLVASLMGMGLFAHNLEWAVIFLLSSISLIWGIATFLSSYLLYRYDQGEE